MQSAIFSRSRSMLRKPTKRIDTDGAAGPGAVFRGGILLTLFSVVSLLTGLSPSRGQGPEDETPQPPVPASVEDGPPVPESVGRQPTAEETAEEEESHGGDGDHAHRESPSHDHGDANDAGEAAAGDQERLSQLERFFWWLGKFHPALIALPVGVIFATGVAELLFLLTGRPLFNAGSRYGIWFAGVATPPVAARGWTLSLYHPTGPAWVLERHQWLGISTAVFVVVALAVGETSFRRGSSGWRAAYRLMLLVTFVLVQVTGFFGGSMLYGLDHYRWPSAEQHDHSHSPTGGDSEDVEQANAETAVIEMKDDFTYEPASMTVPVGTTVRWANRSRVYHTVTADPDRANDPNNVRLPEGVEAFDSGRIQSGESYSHTFNQPGSYRYFCVPHEEAGMVGELEVIEERNGPGNE